MNLKSNEVLSESVSKNSPRSMYQNCNMAPRPQGQNCKFFVTPLSNSSQKRLKHN